MANTNTKLKLTTITITITRKLTATATTQPPRPRTPPKHTHNKRQETREGKQAKAKGGSYEAGVKASEVSKATHKTQGGNFKTGTVWTRRQITD